MSEVIKKAAELADAIAKSEELKNLRSAEQELLADSEAMELYNEFQRLQQMAQMAGTPEVMQQLEEAYKKFAENEKAKAFLEANQQFGAMLETINKMLQEAIEGPKQHGSCGSCGGCGSV
ncbi:YlbF family regulator [Desulfurobacterium sp.]